MSAIFGFVAHQGNADLCEETAVKMTNMLRFRGEIFTSFPVGENALFGTRLFADETIQSGFSCGTFTVVFEGEIYNKKQLIDELCLKEDTQEGEIILALYKKHGLDFALSINGVFSIAVYDSESRQLILARDHVGSHSLYHAKNKHGFFFASTIKALLASGLVEPTLSRYGIHAYFSSTAISPPDTMFSEIHCLRPGSVLSVNVQRGLQQDHTYWNIRDIEEDRVRSLDDFAGELRWLLVDAIGLRARAGRRYGSIVSGGLDSSTITAVLAAERRKTDKLPVFSIDFEKKFYSDAALQQVMHRYFNLQPNSAAISAREHWDILSKAVWYLDCPVNDDALVGMYRVFQLARSLGCSAVFDGEAADELFFTGHVHSERRFQKYLAIPFGVRKILLGSLFPHNSIGGGIISKASRLLFKLGLSDTERRLLVLPSYYRNHKSITREKINLGDRDPLDTARGYLMETQLNDPLNIYHYGLIKNFLPDVLLYKNERMASAHQVMNRTPFIDRRLVELALKIPEKFKVRAPGEHDDGTKIVYKKAIEGIIPDKILKRKKTRGFSLPCSEWYRNELKSEVHDLVFGREARNKAYLNNDHVSEIYTMFTQGIAGADPLFKAILFFELWLREYVPTTTTGVPSDSVRYEVS